MGRTWANGTPVASRLPVLRILGRIRMTDVAHGTRGAAFAFSLASALIEANDHSEEGFNHNGFTLRNNITMMVYANVIRHVIQGESPPAAGDDNPAGPNQARDKLNDGNLSQATGSRALESSRKAHAGLFPHTQATGSGGLRAADAHGKPMSECEALSMGTSWAKAIRRPPLHGCEKSGLVPRQIGGEGNSELSGRSAAGLGNEEGGAFAAGIQK